jgi:exonuclease III
MTTNWTTEEIGNVNLCQYTLGVTFCGKTYKHGGEGIYVSKNIQFNTINLDQYNKENYQEICALNLRILSSSFIVIWIYRSPKGDLTYFLNKLESILNKIYKTSTELILCGDFNMNCLDDYCRKHLLDSLLISFSLFSTVKFPTRISHNSCTLIDNIYISTYKHELSVHPLMVYQTTMH